MNPRGQAMMVLIEAFSQSSPYGKAILRHVLQHIAMPTFEREWLSSVPDPDSLLEQLGSVPFIPW